ncbi:MAG TPA: hypothetical protein VGY76_08350 [Solirubrobacteraceae bacterium]|jgi:hypothetical protein|nr:hypothetical protein [Solirubrobacteraceae bacterium]
MSDFFTQVERELRAATVHRAHRPWYRWPISRPIGSLVRLRIVLVVLALVFAIAAIALAATGVILTGSPVRPASRPIATAGEGIPVEGGSRLLPLRAADPAGGLPWGMRIVHTTRGLICVQLGRVYHGQLGQLGVDGAFGNDGRFHPLPAEALPDVLSNFQGWMSGNCAAPEEIYAGDIVGLQLSAASNPPPGSGVPADRREISFGLLGKHAVSIAYRSGSETRSQPVLPGVGAYLIVERYTSGRQLGSVSETDGRDEPGNYSAPASPNGALTRITYNYDGKPCVDTGSGLRLASCGLSEVPPPRPTPLPIVHVPLHVHLQIHGRVITGADISFRAPYAVTSAAQNYSTTARTCRGLGGSGPNADVARGATVHISVVFLLSSSCTRSVKIAVEYIRFIGGLPEPTPIGTVTIREPPGTHPASLPRRRGG